MTTAAGFEPTRAKPSGFQVHLLNHSDTLSLNISILIYGFCLNRYCIIKSRLGLEPRISGSVDRRLIHWANRTRINIMKIK